MSFLERHPLERGAEEAQRARATITALLAALPGDMQPLFQADMLLFFADLAARLGQLAEASPRCGMSAGSGSSSVGVQRPLGQSDMRCCWLCPALLHPLSKPLPHPSHPCSAGSRLLTPLLSAVNAFLLVNGRDVASQAGELHGTLHAAVLRGSARDLRLREAALTYLRIQLQLGTLPRGSQQLQDVVDWADRELEQPGFKWWAVHACMSWHELA
jgi:hypothetical protein